MKKISKYLLVLPGVIIVCNIPPCRTFFGFDDCSYATEEGGFTFGELGFSGRDFAMCKRKFEDCKKDLHGDTVLYRLSPKKGYAFWNYSQYLFSKKYQLPYKSWESIKSRRGKVSHRSGCQDF